MSGSMRAIGVPMSRDSANSLTKPGVSGRLEGKDGFPFVPGHGGGCLGREGLTVPGGQWQPIAIEYEAESN